MVLHFTRRFRENKYPEWRKDYVDYERMKQVLRQERTTPHVYGTLTPAASFLSLSGASHESTTVIMNETQPLLKSNSHQSLSFETLLREQYDKVEEAYQRHLSNFRDEWALLQKQYHADATPATLESVKNALIELHRLLQHLHNFALLNYSAFQMLLNKHDAIFDSIKQQHMTVLNQHYTFVNPHPVTTLRLQVEEWMSQVFYQGNRSMALASLMTRKEDYMNWNQIYMGMKGGICLMLIGWFFWDAVLLPALVPSPVIDIALTRAYPVYRGIGCILLLHWLIGISLYVLRSARINYRYIFELNPHTTPHYTDVFYDATTITIVYLMNLLLYYKTVNGKFPEKGFLHRGFYPLWLFLYLIYFYLIRSWRQQKGVLWTLFEIVFTPFFPVTFFHVFITNYLTSLVKVFQDIVWMFCFFTTQEFLLPDQMMKQDGECKTNPIYVHLIIPLLIVLPLWWRFLQCIRRIYEMKSWWPNLPNCVNYSLAQVVALFTLFHPFYGHPTTNVQDSIVEWDAFQCTWILLFTISSLYSWAWDVWMDWGLGRPHHKFLSDRHMFSPIWVYYVAIFADMFLRFAWTLTLIPPHATSTLPLYLQPVTMVIELFRRTFWGILRLENEHLHNTQGFRHADFIPLHYDDEVEVLHEAKIREHKELSGRGFLVKIVMLIVTVLSLSVLAIQVHH